MRNASLLTMTLCVVMGLALSACVSGRPKTESYTDKSGTIQLIESDQEVCTRSCNNDYDRCGDTSASRSSFDRGFLGGGADCRASLSSCLKDCKGR